MNIFGKSTHPRLVRGREYAVLSRYLREEPLWPLIKSIIKMRWMSKAKFEEGVEHFADTETEPLVIKWGITGPDTPFGEGTAILVAPGARRYAFKMPPGHSPDSYAAHVLLRQALPPEMRLRELRFEYTGLLT